MQTPLLTYGHASHRGLQRTDNQDSYGKFPREHLNLADSDGLLFIVADGMGGHLGGREASQMAVHLLAQRYFENGARNPAERLRYAFEASNERIFQQAREDPTLQGMGTTCTALALRNHHAWIGHVGDSRAYRITATKGTEQLTHDHSQVEEMVRQNILTPEQAANHPHRNVLSRALGVRAEVEIDVYDGLTLEVGQHYLLCSDGLADVPPETLREIVLDHEPQQACDLLVQAANRAGGHDNVTVLVIRVNQLPSRGARLLNNLRRFAGR